MKLVHMDGTGNTFLVVDAFREARPPAETLPGLARSLCDRISGVGADGLLIVEPAAGFAGRMTVYNADGSIAEMCGNGLRCVGKLIADRFYADGEFVVLTDAGPRQVTVLSSDGDHSEIGISLGRPIFDPQQIPTTLPGRPPVEVSLSLMPHGSADPRRSIPVTCVSMGNPHAVIFVADSDTANVLSLGPLIERHPAFPNRTNVEFVTVTSRNELRLRVWERGVGETAACGTGAAAALVAGVLTARTDRQVLGHLRGGDLKLDWPSDDAEVALTGSAVQLGEFRHSWAGQSAGRGISGPHGFSG